MGAQARTGGAAVRGRAGRRAGLRLRARVRERAEPPHLDERVPGGQERRGVSARGGAHQRTADLHQVLPAGHLLPDLGEGQGGGEAHLAQGEGGRARVRVCARHQRAALRGVGRQELLSHQSQRIQAQVHHHRCGGGLLCLLSLYSSVSSIWW